MDALARLDRKFTALFGPGLDVLADERNLDKTRAYAASFAQSYAKLGAEYAASGLSAASATANGKAYELLVAYAESRVRHNPPLPVDTQAQQLMTEVLLAAQEGLRAQSDTLTHRVAEARREGYVGDGVGDRLARLSLRQGSPASPGGRPSFAPATPTSPGLAPPRVAATPSSSSSRRRPAARAAAAAGAAEHAGVVATPAQAARLAAARLRRDGLGARSGRAAAGSPWRRRRGRAVARGPRPRPADAAARRRRREAPRRVSLEGRGRRRRRRRRGGGRALALSSSGGAAPPRRRRPRRAAAAAPPRGRRRPPPRHRPRRRRRVGERLRALGRALPRRERAGAVPRAVPERALCLRLSAAGVAEVALRLRLFVEVVPIAIARSASLAAGGRGAVERARRLLQLALAPAAAAADGAARRRGGKLPHCRGELSACAPPRAAAPPRSRSRSRRRPSRRSAPTAS